MEDKNQRNGWLKQNNKFVILIYFKYNYIIIELFYHISFD